MDGRRCAARFALSAVANMFAGQDMPTVRSAPNAARFSVNTEQGPVLQEYSSIQSESCPVDF
jgi:hypothetical protein